MNEQSESTHVQDEWVGISQRIRLEIQKRLADIRAMKASEIEELVRASRTALWLEKDAHTFDKEVELELARFSA